MGDSDPGILFDYVAAQLNTFKLAYLHIIEPRVKGAEVIHEGQAPIASQHLRKIFKGRIIAAGGFDALPRTPSLSEATPTSLPSAATSSRIPICPGG